MKECANNCFRESSAKGNRAWKQYSVKAPHAKVNFSERRETHLAKASRKWWRREDRLESNLWRFWKRHHTVRWFTCILHMVIFTRQCFWSFRVFYFVGRHFLAGNKSYVIAMFHHMFPSYPVHVPKRNIRGILGVWVYLKTGYPKIQVLYQIADLNGHFDKRYTGIPYIPFSHLWTNGYRPIS